MKLNETYAKHVNDQLIMMVYTGSKYYFCIETKKLIETDSEFIRYMAYWLLPSSYPTATELILYTTKLIVK